MTIPEILKELELYTGQFPMQAMQVAVEQREAITPELLRAVETVAENAVDFAKRQDYMLHLFALYLLAQFREKRAYLPIIKMVSAPGDTPHDLTGETLAARLANILGSVYNGNPAPLQGLVENKEADEYARASAISCFLVLEQSGQMTRDEVVGYFRSLFDGKLERESSFAWDGLVAAVVELPAPELLEEVRQAYAGGLADPGVVRLEELERDLLNREPRPPERYGLITDAIKEMEWWAAFDPEEEEEPEDEAPLLPQRDAPVDVPPDPPPAPYVPPKPFIREPKIGRNEPCPCGRGKKYKKCCWKG